MTPFLDFADVQRLQLVCKCLFHSHRQRMLAFLFADDSDLCKAPLKNVWRKGWFRAAAMFRTMDPQAFYARLSRKDMAVYNIMCALRPHLSDSAGVCGSFALHVAEQQRYPERARRWAPGDIDLFLAGEYKIRKTADILMELKRRGCALELVHRTSGGVTTSAHASPTEVRLNRLRQEVNKILCTHTRCAPCTDLPRRNLQQILKRLTRNPQTDSYYKFGLFDVRVEGEMYLSFVLCGKHPNITQAMSEFDLSVCRMALQADAYDGFGFVVRMAPCVARDFHLGRCSGSPQAVAACAKLRSRVEKYANRGYRFVGNRCACEGMCGGDRLACACLGPCCRV
jgi:hypothetical protein